MNPSCGEKHGPSTNDDRYAGDKGCGSLMIRTPGGALICTHCDNLKEIGRHAYPTQHP